MVRKQLHQPVALEKLTTSKIAKWIQSQASKIEQINPYTFEDDDEKAEHFTTHKIEAIREYFENTPGIIVDALLESMKKGLKKLHRRRSLKEPLYKSHVKSRMVEVLFTKKLTYMSLDENESDYLGYSLSSKARLLIGLNTLKLVIYKRTLSFSYCDYNLKSNTVNLLKNIPNLKYIITTFCNNNVLNCIVENCKSIEKLDLHYYSYNISNEVLDKVNQLPNLESVSLFEHIFWDSQEQKETEIKKLQNLLNLSSRHKFELKSFVVSSETTPECLQLVVQKYPQIKTLNFLNKSGDSNLKLYPNIIHNLKEVKELEIVRYDFHASLAKEMFKLIGNKIEILKLYEVNKLDLEVIKCIGLMCPKLQKFEMVDAIGLSGDMFSVDIEKPIFPNLRIYEQYSVRSITLVAFFSHLVSVYLLINSPNIEYIEIDNTDCSEDSIMPVLERNPMKHLKQLKISKRLDKLVVHRIIKSGLSPEISIF